MNCNIYSLGLLVMLFLLSSVKGQLKTVPKPDISALPELRARQHVPAPADFKENVYREAREAPVPTATEQASGFILYSRPITQAIHRTSVPAPHERVNQLKTFATPGEFEPLNLAVYALQDLQALRVILTPLRNSAGQEISTGNLDLRLVTEWPIGNPAYTSNRQKTYRMTPELLEKVTVAEAKAGESLRYWLKIKVPADAQPGLYQGSFQVFASQSSMATEVPFTLNVLDFSLLSDPNRGYTAYYTDAPHLFYDVSDEKMAQFKRNEYQAMLDYGLDQLPNFNVKTVPGPDGSLDLDFNYPETIKTMLSMGFKGPILVTNGFSPFYYKYVPGGKIGSHFSLTVIPEGDEVYQAFSTAVRRFREKYQSLGWPEIVMGPVDEPSGETAEVVCKILKAVQQGGLRSYLTKSPTAADASLYRQYDCLDIWCSQPYALPYDQISTDQKYEYWCYPNHNATEMRDTVVMQKGGRMTFGFGFWRSGYKTLIPWHWRWVTTRGKQFEYLFEQRPSGSGNRMDEEGNIIPAIYWECFREGKDDYRYLYTLQQTLLERRGCTARGCQELLSHAETLIQDIWDNIEVQQKYLGYNVWNDSQFDFYRWKMAGLISALRKFPAVNSTVVSPSVLARTTSTGSSEPAGDIFSSPEVEKLTLGKDDFSGWVAQNSEVTASILPSGEEQLPGRFQRLNFLVDHKVDGGGEPGNYPVGWPRTRKTFPAGEIIMQDYDYLALKIRIDSNRNEVDDDNTPITINFRLHPSADSAPPSKDFRVDLGGEQQLWLTKIIPIREMLAGLAGENLSLAHMQFVVSESHYKHGTNLIFDLYEIAFLRNKHPVIESIDCAGGIFLPAKKISVPVRLMGRPGPQFTLQASLKDGQGKTITSTDLLLQADQRQPMLQLPQDRLPAGHYQLEVNVLDQNGKPVSSQTKPIEALEYF
ncbi:MAG: hypothetical protein GX564_00490 [Oligosphaeraceae bacterium]|nr:hypothetical protein [Oligosphaeraceae bacterium]